MQEKERPKASPFSSGNKSKLVNLLFVNAQLKETTFKKTIIMYITASILFFCIAIVLFVVLNNVQEYRIRYYSPLGVNQCKTNESCQVKFEIYDDLDSEVYLMYQVGNFYQNHRRYLQSKSNYQLAGNQLESQEDAVVCEPYVTNKQMGVSQSWQGVQLDPQAIASPCGAIAKTFFNDTYQLLAQNGSQIYINQTGISWPGDKGYKYKKAPNSGEVQWIDPENEHFIVWMRTSGLPNFRKLWGRIEDGLPAGVYTLNISNNYISKDWQGDRDVILTTNSIFGGKNLVMPISFVVLGVGCLIASVFFIRKWRSDKNHLE